MSEGHETSPGIRGRQFDHDSQGGPRQDHRDIAAGRMVWRRRPRPGNSRSLSGLDTTRAVTKNSSPIITGSDTSISSWTQYVDVLKRDAPNNWPLANDFIRHPMAQKAIENATKFLDGTLRYQLDRDGSRETGLSGACSASLTERTSSLENRRNRLFSRNPIAAFASDGLDVCRCGWDHTVPEVWGKGGSLHGRLTGPPSEWAEISFK